MKILIVNGPNLNLLGLREPELYGRRTYADLMAFIEKAAMELSVEVSCFQSNHEGDLIDRIQTAYGQFDGIVINAGGYTHTSVALADALRAVGIPAVEVHLTDTEHREDFRRVSYLRGACKTAILGHGFEGYREAMNYLKETEGM